MRGKSHAAIVSCIIVEHHLDARSEDIVGALPTRTCCRVHSFVVTELGVKKKSTCVARNNLLKTAFSGRLTSARPALVRATS